MAKFRFQVRPGDLRNQSRNRSGSSENRSQPAASPLGSPAAAATTSYSRPVSTTQRLTAKLELASSRQAPDNPLERLHRTIECVELRPVQCAQTFRESAHASCAPFGHHRTPPRRCAEPHDTSVSLIRLPDHKSACLQCPHETRHCRWLDLFRGGEFAQGQWTAEDDHGQRRETGTTEPSAGVYAAQPT
jgi:hypothetical protein